LRILTSRVGAARGERWKSEGEQKFTSVLCRKVEPLLLKRKRVKLSSEVTFDHGPSVSLQAWARGGRRVVISEDLHTDRQTERHTDQQKTDIDRYGGRNTGR
jgi:hypothetical protein